MDGNKTVTANFLEILKEADKLSLVANGTGVFTITVSNPSLLPAWSRTMTDILPDGLTATDAYVESGPGTVTRTGNTVTWYGSLLPGEASVIKIPYTMDKVDAYTNTAITGNGSSSVSIWGVPGVPLVPGNYTISKSVSQRAIFANGLDQATFTIVVKPEAGKAPPAGGVTISDSVPAGLTIAGPVTVSGFNGTTSVAGVNSSSGNNISVAFPSPVTYASVSFPVTSTTVGTYTNTATIPSGSSSATLQVALIKLTKTASKGVVHAGESFTYTITADSGTQSTPGNVTITDAVPPIFGGSGTSTFALGTFTGVRTVTIPATVSSTDPEAFRTHWVRNTANLTCGAYTSNATSDVLIEGLTIAKKASSETVGELAPFTFTVTVTNPAGVSTPAASPVTVHDVEPVNMIVSSVAMSQGSGTYDSFNFGQISARGSATAVITGKPMFGSKNTSLVNEAILNSPYSGNATASVEVLDFGYGAVSGGRQETRAGESPERFGFIQVLDDSQVDAPEGRVATFKVKRDSYHLGAGFTASGSGACPDEAYGSGDWAATLQTTYLPPLRPKDPTSRHRQQTQLVVGGEQTATVTISTGGSNPYSSCSSWSSYLSATPTSGEPPMREVVDARQAITTSGAFVNWREESWEDARFPWTLSNLVTTYRSDYTPVGDPIFGTGITPEYVSPAGPVEGPDWVDTPKFPQKSGKWKRVYSDEMKIAPEEATAEYVAEPWHAGGGALGWRVWAEREEFSYMGYAKWYDKKFRARGAKRRFIVSVPPLLPGDEFVITGKYATYAQLENPYNYAVEGDSKMLLTEQIHSGGTSAYRGVGESLGSASRTYFFNAGSEQWDSQQVVVEVTMDPVNKWDLASDQASSDTYTVGETHTSGLQCVSLKRVLRKVVTTYKPGGTTNPAQWVTTFDGPDDLPTD